MHTRGLIDSSDYLFALLRDANDKSRDAIFEQLKKVTGMTSVDQVKTMWQAWLKENPPSKNSGN